MQAKAIMGKHRAFIDRLKALVRWASQVGHKQVHPYFDKGTHGQESAYVDGSIVPGSRLASQSKSEVAMRSVLSQAIGLKG